MEIRFTVMSCETEATSNHVLVLADQWTRPATTQTYLPSPTTPHHTVHMVADWDGVTADGSMGLEHLGTMLDQMGTRDGVGANGDEVVADT